MMGNFSAFYIDTMVRINANDYIIEIVNKDFIVVKSALIDGIFYILRKEHVEYDDCIINDHGRATAATFITTDRKLPFYDDASRMISEELINKAISELGAAFEQYQRALNIKERGQ